MEVIIVNDSDSFFNLKTDWEYLQQHADCVPFYSTFNFTYNYYTEILADSKSKLQIITVYNENEIIGIAPFLIEHRRLRFTNFSVLSFIGGLADYFNILVHKDVNQQSVLKTIFTTIENGISWDKIELYNISGKSALAHYLLKSSRYNNSCRFQVENPIATIKGNIEGYLTHFVKDSTIRLYNKLKREKDISFRAYRKNEDNILGRIKEVFGERNSKLSNRDNFFKNQHKFNFLKTIFSSNDQVITFCIESKNEIISYISAYQYKGTLHCWNMGHISEYDKYSPGSAIFYLVLNHAFDNKQTIRIVDFGTGRYPWKFKLTDEFIPLYGLFFYNNKSKKFRILSTYDKMIQVFKIILNK